MNDIYSPVSEKEVSDFIYESYQENSPIEIVGQNSKKIGRIIQCSKTLSLEKINGIIEYYPEELYIKVKVGTSLEEIEKFDPFTNKIISKEKSILIYPANIFVTSPNKIHDVIKLIQDDLLKQYEYFNEIGSTLEANRIKERTEFDMEMIKELGYCSGIENYSRYFDGRKPGTRPFCLLDYFPNDYLTIIDESHVTIPQVRAMYGGDRSRKENLVEYGFRLPAAMDNRPLKFEEFELLQNEVIYVSATPADYELEMSEGIIMIMLHLVSFGIELYTELVFILKKQVW